MNSGKSIFAQLMDFLPCNEFSTLRQTLPRRLQTQERFLAGISFFAWPSRS